MTTKRSESDLNYCHFAYSDGRYCTMPAIADTGLCFRHTKQPEPPPPDFNEDIFMNFQPFTNDPPTEDEVHSALARVFMALANHRITGKRAATFGYLGQLMLMKAGTKTSPETLNYLSNVIHKSLHLTYNPNPNALNDSPNCALPSEVSSTSARIPTRQSDPVPAPAKSAPKRSN